MTRGSGSGALKALAVMLCTVALVSCAAVPNAGPQAPVAEIVLPSVASVEAPAPIATIPTPAGDTAGTGTRSGRDIYRDFRDGLASPQCSDEDSSRYARQFRNAPTRMASEDDGDLLALFGYVVDAFRDAGLPTEFTLIPFIESGYEPAAHSHDGAAGMWQFVAQTARDQGIAIDRNYDGRLSAPESTQAAVMYFGHLYHEFGNDWKLAIMGYNAGEFRVKSALHHARKTGTPGLSPVTYAYVQKLHALSCLFVAAGERDGWLTALDRQVPVLQVTALPDDATSLDAWSRQQGHDPTLIRRLNPDQRLALGGKHQVLAPAVALWSQHGIGSADLPPDTTASPSLASNAGDDTPSATAKPQALATHPALPRTHTVHRGETLSSIARTYGIGLAQLRQLNRLGANPALKPGKVLRLR